MVRLAGLEPVRLSAPDPKSGASTNFATGATNGRTHSAIPGSGVQEHEFLPLTRLWEAPVVRTHRKVSCPVGCLLSGGIFHSWADVWFPKGTFTPD